MRRSDRGLPAIAFAALTLTTLASEGRALAFCRTSSCAQKGSSTAVTGAVCTPSEPDDCGIPIFWPNPCVSFSLQKDASKKVSFSVTDDLLKKAFASWTSADCSGKTPRISVVEKTPVECTKHEYNQKAGNANSIIFRDDVWPYQGSTSTLALTTVTYNLDNGEIYDADMELNTAQVNFTTDDAKVDVDLLSVLTHETGHFLGLSHSKDPTATMNPSYKPGDTSLRNLSADDVSGICAIYPPGDIPSDCDPTPRHGFSTLCAVDQPSQSSSSSGSGDSSSSPSGCCAVAAGQSAAGGNLTGCAAALGALALAARRRRHAGPRR